MTFKESDIQHVEHKGEIYRTYHKLTIDVKSLEAYNKLKRRLLLDQDMWEQAVKILERDIKKNRQINKLKEEIKQLKKYRDNPFTKHLHVRDLDNLLEFRDKYREILDVVFNTKN